MKEKWRKGEERSRTKDERDGAKKRGVGEKKMKTECTIRVRERRRERKSKKKMDKIEEKRIQKGEKSK